MDERAFDLSVQNFDLARALLLHLLGQERSPPESIFVDMGDLAAKWRVCGDDIAQGLELLAEKGFIEGPGRFDADFFLFRKVTRKGRFLAKAIADSSDWRAIKTRYLPPA